ncbi:MAG: TonB-dependent receptor [Flavobacteriaceae bacterium]|nr:TonB-dependent receptor [Flavobacteriaceae bacterium]
MKKQFILVFLLSVSVSLFSQNSLKGIITNHNNPIQADIYISKLEKGAITDFDGYYKFLNIPDGTFTIVYSSLGFTSVSKTITFINNEKVVIDIEMKETAVEMEEIIISTPFHKLQRENVMKVERISAQDITNSGALTLAEGITEIPGVSTISTGAGIGKPVIRGLSSNRVLTYTQGVRLENQQFGGEHGLGINAEGISSIEVIKGPASLLYGSDALGGVLYLNPEKFAPENKTQGSIKSNYTTNTLGSSTSLAVKNSQEKFKFIVRGTYATNSDYKTGNNERVTLSRFNESDFKTGFRFQTKKFKSTVRYNYNQSKIGIPEEIGTQTTSKKMELPYQKIDNHILSFNNKIFLTNSSLDITLSYLFNDRNEFEDDLFTPALRLRLNTFGYNVKYNLPEFKDFETIVGVQGIYQTNTNLGEELLIPNATKNDFGVMTTTHYHIGDVGLQGGVRFDTRTITTEKAGTFGGQDYIAPIDKNFSSFNAAIGAKFNVLKYILTRINFASGFRAPNLAELASNGIHEGTNRYEIGNTNLNNEQNFQADVALEFNNDHIEIFANGFYNHINDYIFIEPTNEIIENKQVYRYSQNNAYLYGGEFGFHFHPHPLDWLHVNSSFETVTGKLTNLDYLPLQPANSLSNTVKIDFNDFGFLKKSFFSTTYKNTFNQNNISEFETLTQGYNILNMAIGTQITLANFKAIIGIQATNLTDEVYISHLSRLKVNGIENIGRSINFSLLLQL